jgi:hypothetical protein
MGFQDPASVKGSPTQKLEAFRKVRDEILSEIPQLLERYQEVE